MLFNVDKNRFTLWFKCDRKLDKLQTFSEKNLENKVEVTAQLLNYEGNNKSIISVRAWKRDLTKEKSPSALILDQKIPFVKNNNYHIDFIFDKLEEPIKHEWSGDYKILLKRPEMNVFIQFTDDEDNVIYTCEKMVHPKVAKKEYKLLRKANLIGKPHWDSWFKNVDICCHSCNPPMEKFYEALSNPSYGRVYKLKADKGISISNKENANSVFYFKYKGSTYQKLKNQNLLTFYTKEEYEDYIDRLGYEKDHFKTFEELFDIELTQKEIDSNGNVIGGAYRIEKTFLKETDDLLWNECIKAKDFGTEEDWRDLESKGIAKKVVTDATHSSYPTGTEFCPVCKMMHKIDYSGYHWEGIKLRFIEWFYYIFLYKIESKFRELKVRIADRKYYKKHSEK